MLPVLEYPWTSSDTVYPWRCRNLCEIPLLLTHSPNTSDIGYLWQLLNLYLCRKAIFNQASDLVFLFYSYSDCFFPYTLSFIIKVVRVSLHGKTSSESNPNYYKHILRHIKCNNPHLFFPYTDPPRQQRPSIMAGMIPKTVESLSRAPDTSRGSLSPSPHSKLSSAGGDHRTRYQKEIEEVRLRTNSERTRTDSERTLTDNESSNHTFPGQAGNRMDYYGVQRSTSIGMCSIIHIWLYSYDLMPIILVKLVEI